MKRSFTVASMLALGAVGILSTAAVAPLAAQSAATEVAAVLTTTFAIENMTCALCPVTVKSAMERIDGVQSVEIDFEAKTAMLMSWRECPVMEERLRFVARLLDGEGMSGRGIAHPTRNGG